MMMMQRLNVFVITVRLKILTEIIVIFYVAAIGMLGASAKSADAYQGNMERALSSLYQALGSLREATANKGGHRARAVDLVRQAIEETQAGVEFADEHGGGG